MRQIRIYNGSEDLIEECKGYIRTRKGNGFTDLWFDNDLAASELTREAQLRRADFKVMEVADEEWSISERMRILAELRDAISRKGYTLKYVAERLGVDPAVMTKVLQGKNSTGMDFIAKVAGVLDKSVTFMDLDTKEKCCAMCRHYQKDSLGECYCSLRNGRGSYVDADLCCSRFE